MNNTLTQLQHTQADITVTQQANNNTEQTTIHS